MNQYDITINHPREHAPQMNVSCVVSAKDFGDAFEAAKVLSAHYDGAEILCVIKKEG